MRNNKGQSILEYVIVLTVIVAAIIAGATLFAGKNENQGVGKIMNKAGGTIEQAGENIAEQLKVK